MSDSMGFSLSASPYSAPGITSPSLRLAGVADLEQSSVVLGFGCSVDRLVEAPSSSSESASRELKKLSIVLPKSVHQSAKLLALREDITLTSMIVDLLQQRISAAGL